MRIVLQRALDASVSVNNKIISSIKKGYVLLVGFEINDTILEVEKLAKKVANIRVFEDANLKMNLDIKSTNGEILAISQFTLYADCKNGNRPSFIESMKFDEARILYEKFVQIMNDEHKINCYKGVFGEFMEVKFINDGPVTIVLDSKEL